MDKIVGIKKVKSVVKVDPYSNRKLLTVEILDDYTFDHLEQFDDENRRKIVLHFNKKE